MPPYLFRTDPASRNETMVSTTMRMPQPVITYLLMVLMLVIYGCEYVFAVDPAGWSPSIKTLVAIGGINRNLVIGHEQWFRVFTAPLLHGSILHIVMNCIGLYYAGIILERFVGPLWFFALWIAGAIGGSLMSIGVNSPNITSVGASGAGLGLFTALFVTSYHLPRGEGRSLIQAQSIRVLVPSMLPMAAGGLGIDYGAHFGGAMSGAVIGYLMLKTWRPGMRYPPLRPIAATLGFIGLIMIPLSFYGVAKNYPMYKTLGELIPNSKLPPIRASVPTAQALVERYPQDPRSHMFLANSYLAIENLPDAEKELQSAIELAPRYSYILGDRLGYALHAQLALVLLSENNVAAARAQAAPVCAMEITDDASRRLHDALAKNKLCD